MTNLQPELAAALVAFQASAPTISKGRTANMGTYSYRYADLGDIWDAIRKPLKDNGLAVTQMLSGGQQGFIGIKTTLWHQSGETYSETVELPISARSPQDVGSAITYYKRYALSAALGLSTEEDDDGAAASRPRPEPARTDLDDALDALDDTVLALKLEKTAVAADFYAIHKKPPRHTDAKTVREFIDKLLDKAEAAS